MLLSVPWTSQRWLWATAALAGIAALNEIRCAWLVYRRARKGYNKELEPRIEDIHDVLHVFPLPLELRPSKSMSTITTNDRIEWLVRYLDRARHNISVCMLLITEMNVANALIRAHERNVDVRLISCRSMAYSSGSQMKFLTERGISMRFRMNNTGLMHHKFCLIDSDWYCDKCVRSMWPYDMPCGALEKCDVETVCGRCNKLAVLRRRNVDLESTDINERPLYPEGGVVIVGSINWTIQAFTVNYENILMTSRRSLVRPYQLEFQALWAENVAQLKNL